MSNILDSRFFVIEDSIIDYFKWNDLEWDFVKKKWWSRRYEYKWVIDVCKSHFGEDITTKSFLDIGCGNKHPLLFMMNSIGFKNSTGIDMFDAKKYNYKKYLNKNIMYKKLNILNEEVGYADCISCISVLEHMENRLQTLMIQKIIRSLKHNGCIILTFDYPGFDYQTDIDLYRNIFLENNIVFYSSDNLEDNNVLTSFDNRYANENDAKYKIKCYRLLGIKK